MTIDKQALRKMAQKLGEDLDAAEKRNVELVEALEKAQLEISSANRVMAVQDLELATRRQRIAELEARIVTLPQQAPENLASALDGYEKWLIATTFRDTWNACLAEVTRMNAAGIKVKG
ncbi:hypothetical protein A6858_25325 [Salmonella enterica]|nr:hypothetical protein [Salmonella enterica]EAU0298139.1 hypothetical protein [Salmonella enterica]EBW8697963.1 hypothetical protein [Salmonella enterica subsp. diarizonae serovar 16:z10:e,n,x,z15]HAC8267861.1 hypothetical protein [Salmonella enterica]